MSLEYDFFELYKANDIFGLKKKSHEKIISICRCIVGRFGLVSWL